MYSSSDLNVINDRFKSLDLNKNNQNLTFHDKDFIGDIDNALGKAFKAKTPIIPPHRIDLMRKTSDFVKDTISSSKLADSITIENSNDVHVGHVINITEQIILNSEQNRLEINKEKRDYTKHFSMVDRDHWLAQPSVSEIEYLKKPAKYVIICHTATEEAFTQAENVLKMRLMQTFHIESQGWADVAYNFCIGSDGNVYEGRGWFAEGSHTLNYNKCSFGIGFIGCFLKNLPPKTALKRCKDLIEHAVKIGAVDPSYELVGHSQCRPFLSPGPRLFEEIKTWKNFNPCITNIMPCPF